MMSSRAEMKHKHPVSVSVVEIAIIIVSVFLTAPTHGLCEKHSLPIISRSSVAAPVNGPAVERR